MDIEGTTRAKKLLNLYYQTLSTADCEFPYWYTRSYAKNDLEIPVVRRALALKEAFSHLSPVIYPGELLVMQKTKHFRGSFPMPWLSSGFFIAQEENLKAKHGGSSADSHSKMGQGGGNVVKSFGKVVSIAGKFGMREEEIPALMKLAYHWNGKSVEDLSVKYEKMVSDYPLKEKIMRGLICMFDSGYTLPQGREVANYYYPLQFGFDKLIEMARELKSQSAGDAAGDPLVGMNRLYNYEAIILILEGVQKWILNYADEAKRLSALEQEATQQKEYLEIYQRLIHIAHHPPRCFTEAIQLCWTLHIAILNEDAISGLSPGRMGQILYPYYKKDKDLGLIDDRLVLDWLECQRVKFTAIDCFASMGVVGGVLSGNTFNNLSIGGLDKNGLPACNELEELIIDAGMSCPTPQPTLSLLYDEKLNDDFLIKAIESVKMGIGYPAFMNNQGAIEFLIGQYGDEGMKIEEARAVAIGGCLETSPCSWMPLTLEGEKYWIPGGSGQPTSVGVHFVSLPKILETTLFRGIDLRTGERIFPDHGIQLNSFENLLQAFKTYFSQSIEVLVKCNNIQHDIWRKNNMAIFQSLLKPDCLTKGHLINEMGYRYNATFNIETTGNVNFVNSLASLKKIVYEDKSVALSEFIQAMRENYGHYQANEIASFSLMEQKKRPDDDGKWDKIHSMALNAPKYGNDDPYVDQILKEWEEWLAQQCKKYFSLYAKPYYLCQISVSTHGPMGAVTQATPDGRTAGTTFADGSLSAYPGTDRKGTFALMNSATVFNHSLSQNTQLNIKIHPTAIQGKNGALKLLDLTKSYMRKGGFHVQYNVVDSLILKQAQERPECYRDLMVRVAGFTQYWVELGRPIQDEVIARTEYQKL